MDDSVVPVESWYDQVIGAMAYLNQQNPCNKDGKAIGTIGLHIRATAAGCNAGPLWPYWK